MALVVSWSLLFLAVLCAERVGQMTKTYNDIDAVTRLLEEKERDLELAARIGQSLLKKNKTLTERNELLEEQVEHIREEVSSWRKGWGTTGVGKEADATGSRWERPGHRTLPACSSCSLSPSASVGRIASGRKSLHLVGLQCCVPWPAGLGVLDQPQSPSSKSPGHHVG